MVLGSGFVTVLALCPSSVPLAQVQRSEPLPRETLGGVNGFLPSPDGTHLIYDSDERTDEVFELFSVPADGSSAPVVLSGSLVPGGDLGGPLGILSSYACAPDGTWVAFLADATLDGVHELYRAPLDGSSRLTLSGPLVAGGDVSSFRIAPDGDSIVFLADAEVDERFELFRVPADGSGPRVKLSGVLVNGGDVADFELGASSVRAYYRADAALDEVIELYSVPIDGSLGAVRLNDALPSGRSVVDFRIASNEGRVVFRADGVSDEVHELFSVPADRSSAPVKLNPTPVTDGDVSANYSIDPTDTRLAFLADLDTNDVQELYSVPLDGSAATIKLHPSSSSVHAFRFTPDGSSVLFGGNVGPVRGLFRVPSTGGTPALRSDSLASTAVASPLEFNADGSTCLYVQNHTLLDPFGGFLGSYENLHATGVASGPPIALTTESASGSSSFNPVLFPKRSADGASVFFVRQEFNTYSLQVVPIDASLAPRAIAFTTTPWGCAEVDDGLVLPLESRLSRVALDGSEVLPLSGPLLLGAVVGDVAEFEPTPDGLQVVYRTTFEERLRVVGVGGGSPARVLVAPDAPQGIAQPGSIVLAPDSRSVAFLQMGRVLGRLDLYSAPLRTAEAPRRINDPVAQGTLSSMAALESRFTLDGTRIVFAATLGNTPYALFLAPLDGSVPARRLNGSGADARLWDGAIVSSDERAFALTSDGSRVVYSATTTSGSRHNLFSASLATSNAPVQLTNLTVDGTSVYGNWELTSDGSRVVYMADQDVRFRSELYSVPVDGSAAPVKLNPPLVSGGSVGTWVESATLLPYVRLSPGGTRAVYLADQVTDEKWDLFSVPVDGSAAAVKLSAGIASSDVQPGFQLDPAGTHVYFLADAQSDEVFELFVAPIDGGPGRIKLSGTLVPGGDVQALVTREGLVHFGSGRVVYTADALTNDVVELFSVPVDGSAPPVRLNAALPPGGNVLTGSVLVTADGSTVLYRADPTTNDVFELWRVPIDGSSAPVRVNLALPAGGDVEPDVRVIARGNRLFYRADQDVNDELELYTLRLEARTPRGPALPPPISGTVTRGL